MKRMNPWLFVALIVVLPATVFGVVKWYEDRYTMLPVFGGNGHRIESFQLRNQRGEETTATDWNDKLVVADFFFTHCPVVCPKMIRSLKRVQSVFANQNDLLIASFSVDPERDSSGRLAAYAAAMDIKDNWLLLTGSKKEIYRLARKSFLVTATDGDGGPQDFIHSERLVLIDKKKRIRGYYNGTSALETDNLIRDISRLESER